MARPAPTSIHCSANSTMANSRMYDAMSTAPARHISTSAAPIERNGAVRDCQKSPSRRRMRVGTDA